MLDVSNMSLILVPVQPTKVLWAGGDTKVLCVCLKFVFFEVLFSALFHASYFYFSYIGRSIWVFFIYIYIYIYICFFYDTN